MASYPSRVNARLKELARLEARDERITQEVVPHELRVADLARRFVRFLGMSEDSAKEAWLAGRFHDIGKVAIKKEVLFKPGALTPTDRTQIDRHTELGLALMEADAVHMPTFMTDAVMFHHERFDGQGRFGRQGRAIPLIARILTIADCYDAMRSPRVYKLGMPEEEVLEIMIRDCRGGTGRQFDPDLLRSFVRMRLSEPDCDISIMARVDLDEFSYPQSGLSTAFFRGERIHGEQISVSPETTSTISEYRPY